MRQSPRKRPISDSLRAKAIPWDPLIKAVARLMKLAKRSFWIAAQTVARGVICQLTASHKPIPPNETAQTREPIR
eukprot:scaffold110936_cov66-Phaeocystis_antarctica.AAC.2